MNRIRRAGLRAIALVVAMGLLTAPAFSVEKFELLGTWSVDVTKLQQPDPPKSVTITWAEAGEGRYRMTVTIDAPDGTRSTAEGVFKPDGTASKAVGSLDVDIASATMPNSRTLVMGAGFGGHPASTRVFTLADDGVHMIETVIRHLPDGTPYSRTNFWTRAD